MTYNTPEADGTPKDHAAHHAAPIRTGEQEIYEDLKFGDERRENARLPYVAINMVSSVDGRAAAGGKAYRIGSEVDREAMRRLRAKADAVAIGAGTLRAERLSLGVDATRRLPEGGPKVQVTQPLAVILTASGDVPLANLVLEPGQTMLVFVADDAPEGQLRPLREQGATVVSTRKDGGGRGLDLLEVAKKLASDHGVRVLLAEGGPTLNRALISAGLADELFLTLAPKLLAGSGGTEASASHPAPTTIIEGEPFERPKNLRLLSVQRAGDELFLRYSL